MDDPAARPARQLVEQLFRQDHVPQVVDHEDLLDAVDQGEFGEAAYAGIENQHIETRAHSGDCLGASCRRLEISQFQGHRRGVAGNTGAGQARFFQGAASTDHVGTAQGEHAHALVANAGVAAGYQGRFATEVQPLGNLFSGGVGTKRADRQAAIYAERVVTSATADQGGGEQGCRAEELAAIHSECSHGQCSIGRGPEPVKFSLPGPQQAAGGLRTPSESTGRDSCGGLSWPDPSDH